MLEYNSHLLSIVETKAEREYIKALVDAYNSVSLKLLNTNGIYTKATLTSILSELRIELININGEFQKQLNPNLLKIIQIDTNATSLEYQLALLHIGSQAKLYSLPKDTIKELINIKSMDFFRIDSKGNVLTTTLTADSMIKNIAENQYKKVKSIILGEYTAGATSQEIVRKIKPYLVDDAVAHARTTVKTLLAEASQQSKNKFFDRNADIIQEWLFVATLDANTSSICRSLDGERFKKRIAGIIPPLHPNCRSNLIGILKGYEVGQRPIVLPNGTIEVVKDKRFTYKDAAERFPSLGNKKLIDVEEYKKQINYY